MIPKDEAQQSNTSYVLAFLNDIELLFDYASGYWNLVIHVEHEYGDANQKDIKEKIPQQDYNALKNYANVTRSLMFKTYMRLQALEVSDIEEDLKQRLKSSYEQAFKKMFIDPATITEYVETINKIFVQNVALSKWKQTKSEIKKLSE